MHFILDTNFEAWRFHGATAGREISRSHDHDMCGNPCGLAQLLYLFWILVWFLYTVDLFLGNVGKYAMDPVGYLWYTCLVPQYKSMIVGCLLEIHLFLKVEEVEPYPHLACSPSQGESLDSLQKIEIILKVMKIRTGNIKYRHIGIPGNTEKYEVWWPTYSRYVVMINCVDSDQWPSKPHSQLTSCREEHSQPLHPLVSPKLAQKGHHHNLYASVGFPCWIGHPFSDHQKNTGPSLTIPFKTRSL